jgi:hypothetical protein
MPIGYDAELPLRYDTTKGFYSLSETKNESIKQNFKMLMLTAPGERVMLPDYGVGLRNYLFENDPEEEVSSKIREQVNIFLPEIQILVLQVKRGEDLPNKFGQRNTLYVRVEYLIRGLNVVDTYTLLEGNTI